MPVLILAQNITYRDTITAYSGKSFPCRVTALDDSKIEFIYSINVREKIVVYGIRQLTLDSLGVVYTSESKFKVSPDKLASFIERRNEIIERKEEEERRISEEIKRVDRITSGEVTESNILNNTEDKYNPEMENNSPKWSFGFTYVPYFLGETYKISTGGYYEPQVYSFPESKIMMESQLSYLVEKNLRLIFNLGYTVRNSENKVEQHSNSNNYNSQSGSKIINNIKILRIDLGAKYNILDLEENNVSPFVLLSIGKRFAYAEYSTEDLFPTDNPEIFEDNIPEFLEKMNSPVYFDLGFGAEYSFNRSLTLLTSIVFSYSHSSATYESRNIRDTYEQTISKYFSSSYIDTRIGVGLNFYF
jgi:hypothetical protein